MPVGPRPLRGSGSLVEPAASGPHRIEGGRPAWWREPVSAPVRIDLVAAASASRRLASVIRSLPDPLAPALIEAREGELLAHLRWGSEQLRLALNHGGLMLAYARGPAARADYFARRRDGLGPIPSTLDAARADVVARAVGAAESLDEAAELDSYGPEPGHPRKPGPEYTARYARGHLEALEQNLPRTLRACLATAALEPSRRS